MSMQTYLNDDQIELANSWLPTNCEAYAYNNLTYMMWFVKPDCDGVMVSDGLRLTKEQIRQLDQLRSCNCSSGANWAKCQGHLAEGNTYCG